MVENVVAEVVATYTARRKALLHEALRADATRRPIAAGRARAARRVLAQAIRAEHRDEQPTGLFKFGPLP